jgi:single-stranded DNA-binding protein
MTRGIEAAFWGVPGRDPELKASKSGTPYAGMNLVVPAGKSDDGDVSQWVRVTCFGETAKAIAARTKKGDRIYIEGTLTLNTWADKSTGEAKTGLKSPHGRLSASPRSARAGRKDLVPIMTRATARAPSSTNRHPVAADMTLTTN